MRVLFVDIDAEYLNPTRSLVRGIASRLGTVVFFGPGYVSSEVLREGLEVFTNRNGPFDVVLATEHILFSDFKDFSQEKKVYRKNYQFRFPVNEVEESVRILRSLRQLDLVKVGVFLQSDYYNFTERHMQSVINDVNFVIGSNQQFVHSIRDLSGLKDEGFVNCNDNWRDFCLQYPERIIPLLHFVSGNEFSYTALSHRSSDWCVPGTPYFARKKARSVLERSACSISRGRPLPIGSLLSRIGLRPYSNHLFRAYLRETFREEICGARYSFTCGSGLRYPLRKYFEIPALGSVLVCVPCNGFEELGFRDKANAMICEPDHLLELGRWFNENIDKAQEIADAGRRLIAEHHTVEARAQQLKSALESVLAGRWRGGVWRDGVIAPIS